MLKNIVFIIICIITWVGYSQQEASNWYFGNNAGIRFNDNGTLTELTNGQLSTVEGCATISDTDGNLIFYTDGVTVWNRNHGIMQNGSNLFGDPSSSQSAIVVPQTGKPDIFYIFTVDTETNREDDNNGFNYSIVDMSLNSGLGAVTVKNNNLLPVCTEKVTAVVKDCVDKSIWVVTLATDGTLIDNYPVYNTFFAYEVNSGGLNTTPVTSTFNLQILDNRGYLKFSPSGDKLASANATNGLYLYNFDRST
ncbi:MAG: hypothetical protein ACK5MZ_07695, partial [Aestuariibaculum sp.]